MSTQVAPRPDTSAGNSSTVDTSHVVSDGDEGGSPSEELIQAGDDAGETIETEETQGNEADETQAQEPEPTRTATSATREAEAERILDLESQLAAAQELINEVGSRMDRDPELAKRLNGSQTSQDNTLRSMTEKKIRDKFKPDTAEAFLDVIGDVLDRLDRVERDQGPLKRVVGSLAQTVGSTEFVNSLESNGISREVMQSKPFVRHLQSLRNNPQYKGLEQRSKSFAGEYAAAKWVASKAQVSVNRDDHSRLRTARTGRSGSEPSRGAASAEKVHVIQRTPGNPQAAVDKAHAIRLQAAKAGKDPRTLRFEYVNPK